MPDDIPTLAPLLRTMRERIRSMEQSRFWWLRNQFFGFKRRLRLSAEGAWPPFALPPAAEAAIWAASPYTVWLRLNAPRAADLARMREIATVLPRQPCVTIIYIGGDASDRLLRKGFQSVHAQVYGNWQMCIVVRRAQRRILEDDVARDGRMTILTVEDRADMVAVAAHALSAARGDYVGFLRHGDLLAPEALFDVAVLLAAHPDAEMIYSDEDTVDAAGVRSAPHFKPDWSPELLLSQMYIGDFCLYRRSLIERVSGLRPGFGAAAWYDLALRASEHTRNIAHLPRVLYHRRANDQRPDDTQAAVTALNEALTRRGEPGQAMSHPTCAGTYIARYEVARPGRVSIIIPSRDHGSDVDRCLRSIFAHQTWSNFEVLLVDNASTERSSLEVFTQWSQREPRVRVLRDDSPFNFSRLNNRAVGASVGTYLLFLNNDTEVVSDDWLTALIEQAQRTCVGAVGGRLLFPDGTVQHAGVVLGIGGVAGHSHRLTPAGCTGYFGTLEAVRNYSALTAACLMVRRSVFDEVGGFDPALGVAYNDVDLCLKIRARGYRNVYVPHVVLFHAESKSRGHDVGFRKTVRAAREGLLMRERYGALLDNDPYYNPNLTRRREDYALRLDDDPPTARV